MELINQLVSRYQGKGLLTDTNLLLVYFIGLYDPDRIPRFKRTMTFTVEEFYLLATFCNRFKKIVTTPNILTEVNSLSAQLPANLRSVFYSDFAKRIPLLEEHFKPSAKVSSLIHFDRLGLTDSGIADLVKGRYLVLTDDLRLVGCLQNTGIDVINFNHIRSFAWDA
jgi:hypothetical protein